MSIRLVRFKASGYKPHECTIGNTRLALCRKSETDEFIVRVWIDGKLDEDKCYYTDDKQDALATMDLFAKDLFVKQAATITS